MSKEIANRTGADSSAPTEVGLRTLCCWSELHTHTRAVCWNCMLAGVLLSLGACLTVLGAGILVAASMAWFPQVMGEMGVLGFFLAVLGGMCLMLASWRSRKSRQAEAEVARWLNRAELEGLRAPIGRVGLRSPDPAPSEADAAEPASSYVRE